MSEFLTMLASGDVPLKLYNPVYDKYLFVSHDKKGDDRIVEAHEPAHAGEQRNHFVLKSGTDGRYRLFNPTTGLWLFVSNDRSGGDHVVEAHRDAADPRNEFDVRAVGMNRFQMFSPRYGEFLFLSNDRKGSDNVVEAHGNGADQRNVFALVLPEPASYTLKDVRYAVPETPLDEPCGEMQQIELSNPFDFETTITGTASQTYTHTQSWSSQVGIKVGVSTTFSAQIPFVAEGKITLSAETSFSHSWGETISETRTHSQQISAKVPPRSHIICRYRLWLKKLVVPYTGTLVVHYSGPFGEADYEQPVSGTYQGMDAATMKVEFLPG